MLFFKNNQDFSDSEPQSPVVQKQLPSPPIPESDPPPYPLPSSSRPARVNFLHLEQTGRTIDDSWTVDPFLAIPSALMPPPLSEDNSQKIPNMYLKNKHKPIIARLHLVSEHPCKSRIVVSCNHKDATVIVPERQRQSFSLSVKSSHGQVNVAIPRDFNGPITLTNPWHKAELSDGIKAAMTPFSSPPDTVRLFLGSWDQYDGLEDWKGDDAELKGSRKPIKLSFVDEVKL